MTQQHTHSHDRPEQNVLIPPLGLHGSLVMPDPGHGVVLFAHGSGSSRHSPRNRAVAAHLQNAGLGTLLFDLLMPEEAETRERVFDIDLLAQRLVMATAWLDHRPETKGLPLGYFGASTGAAAAVRAASEIVRPVQAIVSRGGRPDLAGDFLEVVHAPTLLIVGSRDERVLHLNEQALARLPGRKRLAVVDGAGHLFEEEGTLEAVMDLAAEWFHAHLMVGG